MRFVLVIGMAVGLWVSVTYATVSVLLTIIKKGNP